VETRHQRRRHAGRHGARDQQIDFALLVHGDWVPALSFPSS
jgi:hypothetical protein